PQATAGWLGRCLGCPPRTCLDSAPAGAALQAMPLDARLAAVRDGARRTELQRAAESNTPPLDWQGVYVLTRDSVDYSNDPATSLGAAAEEHGETIAEAFLRILLESDGRALF